MRAGAVPLCRPGTVAAWRTGWVTVWIGQAAPGKVWRSRSSKIRLGQSLRRMSRRSSRGIAGYGLAGLGGHVWVALGHVRLGMAGRSRRVSAGPVPVRCGGHGQATSVTVRHIKAKLGGHVCGLSRHGWLRHRSRGLFWRSWVRPDEADLGRCDELRLGMSRLGHAVLRWHNLDRQDLVGRSRQSPVGCVLVWSGGRGQTWLVRADHGWVRSGGRGPSGQCRVRHVEAVEGWSGWEGEVWSSFAVVTK